MMVSFLPKTTEFKFFTVKNQFFNVIKTDLKVKKYEANFVKCTAIFVCEKKCLPQNTFLETIDCKPTVLVYYVFYNNLFNKMLKFWQAVLFFFFFTRISPAILSYIFFKKVFSLVL